MTIPINPALQSELVAARVKLTPMIDGMADVVSMRGETLTPDARATVDDGLHKRQHRAGLIDNALAAYDNLAVQLAALEQDGYPSLPKIDVSPGIAAELSGQKSDVDIALDEFEVQPVAASASAEFPPPSPKS